MVSVSKRYFMIFLIVLFLISWVKAGVTGTLAGKVTDTKTNKPIVGANVFIPDTYLGAATDENGFYVITNIPAKTYQVNATMMGYQTVVQRKVVILTDLRTSIDFSLKPSTIEMSPVVVIAKAPMIHKDVTTTTHFISSQEIKHIPVQSFQDIVDIQPGVAAGHIRGGRKSEVLYLVDGIPIQEAIEGKAGSELPNSSIIDMTVQTGGFNAEYGNAMSGVVNILTREGASDFTAKMEFNIIDPRENPAPFGNDVSTFDRSGEFNVSGPIWRKRINYFLSANFIYPYTRWKDEQFGNRKIVLAANDSYNYNINGKVTFYPHQSTKLTTQGLLSFWSWREYDHKWKLNLDGLPIREKKSYRFSLTAVHTLSPKTFFEIRLSQYNVLKSILGHSFSDTPNITHFDYNLDGIENELDWPGYVKTGKLPLWLDHEEVQTLGRFDFISQINPPHQIKTGIHLTYYDLYKKNVQAMYLTTYDPKFPQYITYDTEYNYYPWRSAFYIQDKIEYEGMVVNIGLRYDYFDPQATRPALEEKIVGDQSEWIINNDKTVPAAPKQQISPRLGLALPVSDTDILHVNYGLFFQMPVFDYLYTNSNLSAAQGFSPLGDPDLKPAKTIMWEVSYKRLLSESMMFDATIFYKDISNLVDANTFKNQTKEDIYGSSGFTRFVNLAVVSVYGLEFYLKRDYNRYLSGKLSYTYMIGKGTGSSELEKFVWTEKNYQVPVDLYYISWDQRHTIVLNVDIRKPEWGGVNILWRWNSPLPYTHNEGLSTIPNNARMDPTTTLDIRFNKGFKLGSLYPYVFGEILNSTDHLNILWVDDTGQSGGELGDPSATDNQLHFRLGAGIDF